MRYLVEYPITAEEVKETIQQEITKLSQPGGPIGGINGAIWHSILKTLDIQLDKDLTVMDLVLDDVNP